MEAEGKRIQYYPASAAYDPVSKHIEKKRKEGGWESKGKREEWNEGRNKRKGKGREKGKPKQTNKNTKCGILVEGLAEMT